VQHPIGVASDVRPLLAVDRQPGVAIGQERTRRREFVRRDREGQIREPREDRRKGDLRLEPGERRADAMVDAVSEGEVLLAGPGDVKDVRGIAVLVAVSAG
jgi:hypothetical protein